ncbi:CBO0543 family protein [Caldalkalibacillus mannanilyticus]|uniref:CBO0543 family protein n=1 Tax=Caldalkalibacillus mannanilyticus TaxID=1418 RepID=UPI0004699DF1|nr:CBO0543 family protein [Caldalkalibacillus mannanilyticus]
MKNSEIVKIELLFKQIHEINVIHNTLWLENVLFSWQWWLGVVLTLLPWVIWGFFRKKESTMRLLTAGLFIMVISFWLDSIGVQFGLWYYQYSVIPFIPAFVPWNTSLLPVFVMLLLQTEKLSTPFSKALLFSAFTAFIAEPFFVWVQLYDPVNWEFFYSFPIYIVLYFFAHFLATRHTYHKL